MSTMNIAGLTAVDDPNYRYRMPRVIGKVEGRGNGIKTVLMNVTDVAASLNRDAPEVTKFFGCEIGSQTTYAADRAIVNGQHRDQDLQNHLTRYIENFVLCKNCRLPETHYKIKDGMISQKCLACGHKECVDMTHKLTAFILAQHKKNKEATKGDKGDKKDKKDKKDKSEKSDKPEKTEKEKSEKKEKKKDKADKEATEDGAEKKKDKKKKKEEVDENVFGITADGDEEDDEESDSKAAGNI